MAKDKLLPMEEVEKRYILTVLRRCGGNKKHAADRLGISRRTLQRRILHWRACAKMRT
jgi:transcriptional regulator with PAS, ATPase and Fis domain